MKTFKTTITLCLLLSLSVKAQDWKAYGVDELFEVARNEVFSGERAAGQEKLLYILEKSPDYLEVKIFLARSYSWDGLYGEARKDLQFVLQRTPGNREATEALMDVEMWSDNFSAALLLANNGLKSSPDDEYFLYKQASALYGLGKDEAALISLRELLAVNPASKDGLALKSKIKVENLKYTAGASCTIDFFDRTFDPGKYFSAQLGRTNSWGSSTVRFNYAQRFDTEGVQWEADLYPGITKGLYAYLNYGYSDTDLFPEHRGGAEIFMKLPKRLEASVGARYMRFDQDTKITIYTGSIGWYFKNYWISLRPYITPDPATGTSTSATFFVRRYFSDGENYVGLNAGLGFSPDFSRIQSGSGLSDNEIYTLRSQKTGITWQQVLKSTWIVNITFDVARQELIFDQGQYVTITSAGIALRKKF